MKTRFGPVPAVGGGVYATGGGVVELDPRHRLVQFARHGVDIGAAIMQHLSR